MDENTNVSANAAVSLQAIIEEERTKRVEAENLAQSLVEEFTSCNDFDEVRNTFRDKIKELAPMAIVNIVQLMNNADSESVRANLNKWVLEWAMSEKIDGSDSELKTFLKDLQKQPPVIEGKVASDTEPAQT